MPIFNPFKIFQSFHQDSFESEDDNTQQQHHHQTELLQENKIVLLGTLQSGKSTLFKLFAHLKRVHYSPEELEGFKGVIYSNIVLSLFKLIEEIKNKNSNVSEEKLFLNYEQIKKFINLADHGEMLLATEKFWDKDFSEMVLKIYNEPSLQKLLIADNHQNFDLNIEYFMKNFNRIQDQSNYLPVFKDCLNARVKTTGIVELHFQENDKAYNVTDVGGMRNERRKWIHIMDNINMIIFTIPLNDFYMKCYEDDSTNRLKESLLLFDEIFNSNRFIDIRKIVLFTKVDLFIEKIKQGTFINKYFDGFKGDKYNPEHVFEFILNLFRSKVKKFKYHVVNLTDVEEAEECLNCILSGQGQFISHSLLLNSGYYVSQNNLFKTLKNVNLTDVSMYFN
ncbi:hypothetical protein ABK040_002026 [Willaertia magna]